MSKLPTLLAASLLCIAQSATAEPLSREIVISRASADNAQNAAAQAQVDGARALRAEADAARWPQVTLRLGIGPSMRADLEPGTSVVSTEGTFEELGLNDLSAVFGGRLEVVQPLYTFGKIALRQSAADHGIRAEEARAAITAAEVALASATLYETYLFARDATRFFEEIEHTLNRSILATQSRIDKGQTDVSEQDLFRLETARSIARLGLSQARAGTEQAAAGLRAFIGLPANASIEVQDDRLLPLGDASASIDELIATTLEQRPELHALSAGEAAYSKLAEAERAGYKPDFFVAGSLDVAYTPGREFSESRYVVDPLGHFVPTLIVGLSWSLNGPTSGARARKQEAEALRLRKVREWAESAFPAEVRVAALDAKRARADITESTKALSSAKKWLVQASADYAAGLADSKSLADSIEAYATMRVANLDAIKRFNIAMATLAKVTGTLVANESTLYPGNGDSK